MKYKQTFLILLSFVTLILVFSCGNASDKQGRSEKKEIPPALDHEKTISKSLSRTSRSGNLVDQMYQDLVEKSPDLKKLEEDLTSLSTVVNDSTAAYKTYDDNSRNYYSSAIGTTNEIQDSVLKKKMIQLIQKSDIYYSIIKAKDSILMAKINSNNVSVNDYYTILKITSTLKVIENYQKENLPGFKTLQELVTQQDNAKEEIKKQTPKY